MICAIFGLNGLISAFLEFFKINLCQAIRSFMNSVHLNFDLVLRRDCTNLLSLSKDHIELKTSFKKLW